MQIFGFTIPFIFYVPYVPFEFVVGAWILIKGVDEQKSVLKPTFIGAG
jgi:hypothetical protein